MRRTIRFLCICLCSAHAIILFRRGQPGYLALLLARKETEFLAPGLREGFRVKKPVLGSQFKVAETMMEMRADLCKSSENRYRAVRASKEEPQETFR